MSAAPRFSVNGTAQPRSRRKAAQVHEIAINRILSDGDLQPRGRIDIDMVREYAEAMQNGDIFPPIDVFFDGRNYWLADGFTRYTAAIRVGKVSISATVHDGDKRDAILFSASANANHGQRRTNDDKRRAVLKLLNDPSWSLWSDRQIAEVCKVSHSFVTKFRRQSAGAEVKLQLSKDGELLDLRDKAEELESTPPPPSVVRPSPDTPLTKKELTGKYVSAIAKALRKNDDSIRENVRYAFGTADIVSDAKIYGFCQASDRSDLYGAVGTLTVAAQCINPDAGIVIVGHYPAKLDALIRVIQAAGIEVTSPEKLVPRKGE